MFNASDNINLLLLLAALGVIGWGYYRTRPYGKVGLLSWLQSVILILPWLAFFGLSAFGIYLNITLIFALFLAATGCYIILGRKARAIASQDSQEPSHSSKPPEKSQDHPGDQTELPTKTSNLPSTPSPAPTLAHPAADHGSTAVPPETLKEIQSIFGIDTFFATETLPYQEGIISRAICGRMPMLPIAISPKA